MNAMRVRDIAHFVFSPRGLFWLVWLWVLNYVTVALWWDEAFARFVMAHRSNLLVLSMSVITVAVILVIFLRYAVSGFKARGSGKFVLWLVLPLGVLLYLVGFVASAGFGQGQFFMIQEGQEFSTPWNNRAYVMESIDADIVKNYFEAENRIGILRSEPHATFSSGKVRHTTGAFPPTSFKGSWFHMLDFGVAPGFELFEDGQSVLKGNVNMRLLPPGREDALHIEGLPYSIYMRLAPERILEEKGQKLKVYDLVLPKYFVRVEKAGQVVFEGDSTHLVEFDEFILQVHPDRKWVWLEVRHGIGTPLVWAGFILMGIGLPLTLIMLLHALFCHIYSKSETV